MAKKNYAHWRTLRVIDRKGVIKEVRIEVDAELLCMVLAKQAANNRSGKASVYHGCIKAKVIG